MEVDFAGICVPRVKSTMDNIARNVTNLRGEWTKIDTWLMKLDQDLINARAQLLY